MVSGESTCQALGVGVGTCEYEKSESACVGCQSEKLLYLFLVSWPFLPKHFLVST